MRCRRRCAIISRNVSYPDSAVLESIMVVLGVDGGNSKTIALVARLDGTILGWGRSGCGDIYGAASPAVAIETLSQAVGTALEQSVIEASALSAACFSLAGADWPEDFAFLQAALEQRGFGHKIQVVNDAMGALRAGSTDGTGVVVACGTGAAVGAKSADGHIWHSSFWQVIQGAGQLGHKTLRTIYESDLGIQAPTTLTNRVLDYFGQSSVEQLLHLMTARETTHPSYLEISQISRLLLDEAERGDMIAKRIVVEHGAALGDYVVVAARKVGIECTPFTLVLMGGVLRHPSSILTDAIIERVRHTSPEIQPIASRFEPVIGALLLALEDAGQIIDSSVISNLVESMPTPELFATAQFE
jgi:N-acetylglucosamine kinase-like BadF-type ATPase